MRRDTSSLLSHNSLQSFTNDYIRTFKSAKHLTVLRKKCLHTLGDLGLSSWSCSSPTIWDNNIFPLQQSDVGLYQLTCSQKQFITALRCETSCWHKATAPKGCCWSNGCSIKYGDWEAVGAVRWAGRLVVWGDRRGRNSWENLGGLLRFLSIVHFQARIQRSTYKKRKGGEGGLMQFWGLD